MVFYKPISIREAVENVNKNWFLPAVQRPYDWGERYKKKDFIKKLFDSISRQYPIGTLIIWDASQKIPFRRFLTDFDSRTLGKIEDRGKWGNRELVYDGQQRLQSLYSCLKHTFEGDVLSYDLLFDRSKNKEPDGFIFFEKNKQIEHRYLRLNALFRCKNVSKSKIRFRAELEKKLGELSNEEREIFLVNFDDLWKLFVEEEVKLLSYYPLKKDFDDKEVLDIFKRINTTGMMLTKSEILFSMIKRNSFRFEERIWDRSKKIEEHTGGFTFNPDDILQIIYLIKIGTMRIDPDRVNDDDLKDFVSLWRELESPLHSFFSDFLFGEFRINRSNIIRSKNALVPLILFFYYMRKQHNINYRNYSKTSRRNLKKYLILSQLNDWRLQGYIDNARVVIEERIFKNKEKEFPFITLRNLIEKRRLRDVTLNSNDLVEEHRWFSLKIIAPNKQYHVVDRPDGRFNPEIDHIFPLNPDTDKPYNKQKYRKWAETLWNLQPIKGDINNLKQDTPPKEFFIKYPEHIKKYDHLPIKNIRNEIWSIRNVDKFVKARKRKMLRFIKNEYGLSIKEVKD